jgi:hypothetical protein
MQGYGDLNRVVRFTIAMIKTTKGVKRLFDGETVPV